MESNLLSGALKMRGNSGADCTLLVSDLFNLFPGSFDKVLLHFENHYQVAVYEDDGVKAGSFSLRHQSMEGYADDLIYCLRKNGLRNITYVAHSINALLAFTAVARAPDLFDKVIVISAFPCLQSDPGTHYTGGFATDDASDLFAMMMLKHRETSVATAKGEVQQLTDILAGSFSHKDLSLAQGIFRLLLSTDCRDYLHNFPAPVLILQSLADKFSTSDTSFFMYRKIPDSRILKIKAKGHLPQLCTPGEIVKLIEFFTYLPVC